MLIIANPAAGRSRARHHRLTRVIEALQRRGCTVALRRAGLANGEVERLARDAAAEFDVVVAAGGDGTANAVANGIAGSGCALALLPFGTANVLAREIGLPRRVERLAALIAAGRARPIRPGRIRSAAADRLFLTMASSGFDAAVVAAVGPRLKRRTGRLAFAWAILACLINYRGCPLSVSVDGVEHRASAVIAAKGRFYAGGFTIAPGARLAEPMLDLLLFQRAGRLALLRYLAALPFGRLAGRRDIVFLRARHAALSAADPLPVQADGEFIGQLPVMLEIAEEPLSLVQP